MPSAAPPSRKRSPGWRPSSPPTARATPPARSSRSMAAAAAAEARCSREPSGRAHNMAALGTASLSGDDRALPDHELVLLERARELIPRLAERAPATTAARNLPPETIAEYRETGILRILQPRRFGGLQGRFSLFSRIVEELTFGCASSAWVYAVLAEHQWIIAQYPEQAQIDVWGDDPLAVASSSLAPRAAAQRTPGGWRLSGRYNFSSGCDYAQWAILGAFLGEMGDPRTIAYVLVRLSEVEIVDDWQVLGLAGTGSKSLLLDDV